IEADDSEPRHQERPLRPDADAGLEQVGTRTSGVGIQAATPISCFPIADFRLLIPAMACTRVRRLTLTNFRSYHSAQIEVSAGPVVLVGPNGAGKTNLIEAISFLAPGRGLRRAVLGDVAFSEGDGSWAVAADVEGALGLATLGTGIEPPASEDAAVARKCRIDREPVASTTAFADHLRVVWLVPAMDGLFNGPTSERRRFLDRLVLAVD